MDLWYATEYEADPAFQFTYSTMASFPTVKIDYGFNHYGSYRSAHLNCSTAPYTDHCFFMGTFSF